VGQGAGTVRHNPHAGVQDQAVGDVESTKGEPAGNRFPNSTANPLRFVPLVDEAEP